MTLLLDTPAANGVHVLIIGVGGYDATNIKSLRGAALSARRMAEFWLDSSPSLLDGHSLASVQLLASDSDRRRVKCRNSEGVEVTVDEPTFDEVGDAIRGWVERSQGAAIAVLHWIGHGETTAMSGEEGAVQALYCRDAVKKVDQSFAGVYNWTATRLEIEVRLSAPKLFFIDACQVKPAERLMELISPWRERSANRTPVRGAQFRPGIVGNSTYCVAPGTEISPGLNGGAVFTEAIRRSLQHYGAKRLRGDRRYAAHCDPVKEGAEAHMERWRRNHPRLAEQPVLVEHYNNWLSRDPIMLIAKPRGLMDLHPVPCGRTQNLGCEIKGHGEAVRTPAHWECDLEYGEYQALVTKRAAFRSPQALTSWDFSVESPADRVDIDGC